MKKKILIFIGMIAIITGCSAQTQEIDIEMLAKELLENVTFEDELTAVEQAMGSKIYEVEDDVKNIVYISSGATSEEIALFEFQNEEAAKTGYEKAKDRVERQKENYATYIPEEVSRLDQAIIEKYGKYVILCITNDQSAEQIIQKYIQ